MPEYRPRMLESQSVKLIQHPIYYEDDELIHPAMYYEKFKEGTIVEVVVSMEAMHLKKDIVSRLVLCRVSANLIPQWGCIRVHAVALCVSICHHRGWVAPVRVEVWKPRLQRVASAVSKRLY
jgi:hypothetical protein